MSPWVHPGEQTTPAQLQRIGALRPVGSQGALAAPQPRSETFRDIWYATRARIESPTKLFVTDDKGTLEVGNGLRFSGAAHQLEIGEIIDISIVGQRANWVPLAAVFGPIAVIVATQAWWVIQLILNSAGKLLLLFVGAAYVLLFAATTRWVRVVYRDADGIKREAFFANRLFTGGTQRLFETISKARR